VNLRQAVMLVWGDVADGVLSHPKIATAVRYALDDVDTEMMDVMREDQVEAEIAYEGEKDVYEAYVMVRSASKKALDEAIQANIDRHGDDMSDDAQ